MGEQNGFAKTKKGSRISNGKLKANGHAPATALQTKQPTQPTWRSFMVDNALRLFVWYVIATVVFRCPSTKEECEDDTSPICKTYFGAKDAITPHIEPYFDAYAAPYIEVASPYAHAFSDKVVKPTRTFVVHHGGPRLSQAKAFAQAQWRKSGKPQVDKLQAAAMERYQQTLAPHVERASDAMSPYVDVARTSALQTYYEFILPTYDLVTPYAVQTYDAARVFTTEIALPSVSYAFNRSYVFMGDNILPHVWAAYAENVEPQLIRIGERLGRYKGSPSAPPKKSAAATRDGSSKSSPPSVSSFNKPSRPVKDASVSGSTKANRGKKTENIFARSKTSVDESVAPSAEATPSAETAESMAPAPVKENLSKEEVLRIARETVAEDLELWQTKFSNAADEGAAEIEDKIERISEDFKQTRIKKSGTLLLSQLEVASKEELETLKGEIVALIGGSEGGDMDATAEQVLGVIRKAGLSIKSKAENVRTWREEFEQELQEEVTGAAQEHFNILGSIRDLALQKIGMKWAWMDGITYKDWAKYHELKKKFDEWTHDLQQLIVTHPALESAMEAAGSIEDGAMDVAQAAAAELSRVKEAAGWKVMAGDATDNFDIDAMREAAEAAGGDDADDADESLPLEAHAAQDGATESQPTSAAAVAAPVAEEVVESEPAEPLEPVEDADSVAAVAAQPEESTVAAKVESPAVKDAETAAEEASASHTDMVESVASPVLDSMPEVMENVTAAVKDAMPVSAANEVEEEEEEEEVSGTAQPDTATVKPALFGAAAQIVPGRQVVLDDDDDVGDKVASATAMVHAAYSSAVARASAKYSAAMSVVSAQVKGTPLPAHEAMFSSVSSAYDDAMASASSRMGGAMDAVTKGALTKTTETASPLIDWVAIESMASERLEEGRLWAEQQYESAKIVFGLATPTPTSAPDRYMEQAKMNYYAGLGFAQARYSEFLLAAESALATLTGTPTPTPTNVMESASSMASVAGESVAAAAAAVKGSVDSVVDGAENAVAQSWEVIVNHISVQIYGEPTPTAWYDGIYSLVGGSDAKPTATGGAVAVVGSATNMAAEQYSAVSSIVSELILGKDQPYAESIFSRLNSVYTAGASMADSATSAAASAAAAATEALKDKVEHARDEL